MKKENGVAEIRAIKINERERLCLEVLMECYSDEGMGYVVFRPIIKDTGLTRPEVRRAVRSLARKGLAHYSNALWSDDGPMGAGYCCTEAGKSFLAEGPTKKVGDSNE